MSQKEELEAAYKSLDKAERQIRNLIIERKQLHMVLKMLETAGFIKQGKREEATEFCAKFLTNTNREI